MTREVRRDGRWQDGGHQWFKCLLHKVQRRLERHVNTKGYLLAWYLGTVVSFEIGPPSGEAIPNGASELHNSELCIHKVPPSRPRTEISGVIAHNLRVLPDPHRSLFHFWSCCLRPHTIHFTLCRVIHPKSWYSPLGNSSPSRGAHLK